MTDRPLTVLFLPESAYGPTGNCIGIGNVLLGRGHRVVFAAEASWKGRLEPLGFVEDLVDLAPPPDGDDDADPGAFWKEFIRETSPEFRKPTIDQLESFVAPTYQALIDGVKYCEPHLREIIARQQPDVVVEDNVVIFPALMTAAAPFVRIVSCNPLEVKGPGVAPTFSALIRSLTSTSCPSPSTPTCMCSRRRPTTSTIVGSTPPGTGSTPASARPTNRSSYRHSWLSGQKVLDWSTSHWDP
jgi:UDP:flavonoid glycosyltransferase YjiC (YdhE family)